MEGGFLQSWEVSEEEEEEGLRGKEETHTRTAVAFFPAAFASLLSRSISRMISSIRKHTMKARKETNHQSLYKREGGGRKEGKKKKG
jgi:hypothetical protein